MSEISDWVAARRTDRGTEVSRGRSRRSASTAAAVLLGFEGPNGSRRALRRVNGVASKPRDS